MAIPQTFIDDLNDRIDLPRFIQQYVPELKKKSGDTWEACCPFHEEKTPSFTVSERKGFYHCFGCPAHGNAINFLMEKNGMRFPEAVEEVAAFMGLQVPKDDRPERTEQEKKDAIKFMKAIDALERAQLIYAQQLVKSADARAYLTERGVSAETIERFGLGYAPDEWNTITGNKAFTKDALEDSGLSAKKEPTSKHTYDRFRDRIMVPIYDRKGRVIGFGGRAVHGQEPKYLNSPESVTFKKGVNLFGLKQAHDAIQKTDRVFVVEGYMDDAMLFQYGVENVVATMGTAITDTQMRRLFSLCKHVTFCLDGDKPGRNAAWKATEDILPLLDDEHIVDFIFFPNEQDPDEYVREKGKAEFDILASSALTLTDYLLSEFESRTDFNNGESLARFLAEANKKADLIQNALVKLSFQKRIAEVAKISLDTMLNMLKEQKVQEQSKHHIVSSDPAASELPAAEVSHATAAASLPRSVSEISVAAKLLGISVLKDRSIVDKLDVAFLGDFLSSCDKEMLFPLLAYIRANPASTDKALEDSLSFNPQSKLISSLILAAHVVGDKFDAMAEAKLIVDTFRHMDRFNQIVQTATSQPKAA